MTTAKKCNRHGLERQIGAPERRQIRQECSFCCVLCEEALVEYHHFAPQYTDATKHDPAGITLLCGTHHARVTRGHLSDLDVAEADRIRRANRGFVSAALLLSLRAPALVVVGPMIFEGLGELLRIHGQPILEVSQQDGRVFLSGTLFDAGGRETLCIEENVVRFKPDNWDVETEGPLIRIRSGPRRIVMELRIWPPFGVHIERLNMQHQNWSIDADLDHLHISYGTNSDRWDLSDAVVLSGGTTTLERGGRLVATGGTIICPTFGARFRRLAQRGDFPRIADEIRRGVQLHVHRRLVGWALSDGRQEVTRFLSESVATARARHLATQLMATAPIAWVVNHRESGRIDSWFPEGTT